MITKLGNPSAVIMSIEDLESLEDTLEILSDPKAMKRSAKLKRRSRRERVFDSRTKHCVSSAVSERAENPLQDRVVADSSTSPKPTTREGRDRRR
ncbi:MAG: type II toxin-antitoxin system Phd/YefM family antitoxin [Actinomycetota bacterium]